MLLADEVEHVGRVAGVEQREVGREAERDRVLAHEPVRDRVERASEHPARATAGRGSRPIDHLARRPAREGEQQDALVRHAPLDETRDPRAQRRRLARPRAREHEQVAAVVVGGGLLLVVEAGEGARLGERVGCEHVFAECRRSPAHPSTHLGRRALVLEGNSFRDSPLIGAHLCARHLERSPRCHSRSAS